MQKSNSTESATTTKVEYLNKCLGWLSKIHSSTKHWVGYQWSKDFHQGLQTSPLIWDEIDPIGNIVYLASRNSPTTWGQKSKTIKIDLYKWVGLREGVRNIEWGHDKSYYTSKYVLRLATNWTLLFENSSQDKSLQPTRVEHRSLVFLPQNGLCIPRIHRG